MYLTLVLVVGKPNKRENVWNEDQRLFLGLANIYL